MQNSEDYFFRITQRLSKKAIYGWALVKEGGLNVEKNVNWGFYIGANLGDGLDGAGRRWLSRVRDYVDIFLWNGHCLRLWHRNCRSRNRACNG